MMNSRDHADVVECYTPNGGEIRRVGKSYEVQPHNDNYWITCATIEEAYRAYHPDWDGENLGIGIVRKFRAMAGL